MGSCSTLISNCNWHYPFFLSFRLSKGVQENVCRKQQVGAAGVALDNFTSTFIMYPSPAAREIGKQVIFLQSRKSVPGNGEK